MRFKEYWIFSSGDTCAGFIDSPQFVQRGGCRTAFLGLGLNLLGFMDSAITAFNSKKVTLEGQTYGTGSCVAQHNFLATMCLEKAFVFFSSVVDMVGGIFDFFASCTKVDCSAGSESALSEPWDTPLGKYVTWVGKGDAKSAESMRQSLVKMIRMTVVARKFTSALRICASAIMIHHYCFNDETSTYTWELPNQDGWKGSLLFFADLLGLTLAFSDRSIYAGERAAGKVERTKLSYAMQAIKDNVFSFEETFPKAEIMESAIENLKQVGIANAEAEQNAAFTEALLDVFGSITDFLASNLPSTTTKFNCAGSWTHLASSFLYAHEAHAMGQSCEEGEPRMASARQETT